MNWDFVKRHALGIAVAVVVVIGGRAFLAEHDARLQADVTVKAAQSQIADLQQQYKQVDANAKAQVAALQRRAIIVQTPVQAIQALPEVVTPETAEQLNPTPLPDAPSRVAVEAVPLYQALNACRQDSVNLAACTGKLDIEQKVVVEKDTEIQALKKKPSFWSRVKHEAITIGVSAAIGYALRR